MLDPFPYPVPLPSSPGRVGGGLVLVVLVLVLFSGGAGWARFDSGLVTTAGVRRLDHTNERLVVVHITRDETVVPLAVGGLVMRAVEVDPSVPSVRVSVSRAGGGEPALMRVYLPRRLVRARFDRLPLAGDLVWFDGLRLELVTVKGRCRWAVRARAVEVVDRVAA